MSDTTSHVQSSSSPSSALTTDPSSGPSTVLSPFARTPERRLRLWPGVVLIILQAALLYVPGWMQAGPMTQFMCSYFGPIATAALLTVWWLFFSRLAWTDRLLGLAVFVAGGGAAWLFSSSTDPQFRVMGLAMYVAPVATTFWVLWLLLSIPLSWPLRRAGLLTVLLLGWLWWPLVRMDGLDGSFSPNLVFRWSTPAEEKYVATLGQTKHASAPADAAAPAEQPGDWTGFRGPQRDGRLLGVRIGTDWNQNPPRQVWKRLIGPGWSSFAVVGRRLYTQEQRSESEVVVCLDADTGAEYWAHEDVARFTEIVAGPGPRATPTFHAGKIYALGASGLLNCLDAATGKSVWQRDIKADSEAKTPTWGFSASPLVVHGVVIVYAGGPKKKCMLAYHADSGKLAWAAGEDLGHSYCSPHLANLAGVEQVLVSTESGLTAFDPVSGKVLWQNAWPLQKDMARVVQPVILNESEVMFGTPFAGGLRRLRVAAKGKDFTDEEVWTSTAMKPYYNDGVVYKDHLYGFDGAFFTCVSLEEGASRWRTRGYGSGQVLLLADQGLLLVLSEKGEAVLLEASPERHKVVGRFPALTGKTWNHPVVAHGKLFVRNGEEAACYQLASPGKE